jgi:hypothetical protein
MCFWVGRKIFCLKRLAQGWTYSPMYFTMALSHVLSHVVWPEGCTGTYYQDDILVIAATEAVCLEGKVRAVKVLTDFKFECRPDKCEGPTRVINFCGVRLDGPVMVANPGRSQITQGALRLPRQQRRPPARSYAMQRTKPAS